MPQHDDYSTAPRNDLADEALDDQAASATAALIERAGDAAEAAFVAFHARLDAAPSEELQQTHIVGLGLMIAGANFQLQQLKNTGLPVQDGSAPGHGNSQSS